MTQFDDERKPLVAALLAAIVEECPGLSETIKWNAPTFCDNGKDRMTLMLHKKDRVGLILHTGARPKEDKNAPTCIPMRAGCSNGTRTSAPRFPFLPGAEASG